MSEIAERAGIGRATLYKYFSDVQGILTAWHERQVRAHLEQLKALIMQPGDARTRLETYARMSHGHHGSELVALLHSGERVADAHRQLRALVGDLVAEGARRGSSAKMFPPRSWRRSAFTP